MGGQVFLPGVVLSHQATAGNGALPGDVKLLGLHICEGVVRLGTYVEFYTECIAFTRICLPYAKIIMVCIHVSLVELPFRTVMGWIPVLECILSGVCGLLQSHPISSGSERYCPLRPSGWSCKVG
jgi:hypothetical protein